mgnify:FL=1
MEQGLRKLEWELVSESGLVASLIWNQFAWIHRTKSALGNGFCHRCQERFTALAQLESNPSFYPVALCFLWADDIRLAFYQFSTGWESQLRPRFCFLFWFPQYGRLPYSRVWCSLGTPRDLVLHTWVPLHTSQWSTLIWRGRPTSVHQLVWSWALRGSPPCICQTKR